MAVSHLIVMITPNLNNWPLRDSGSQIRLGVSDARCRVYSAPLAEQRTSEMGEGKPGEWEDGKLCFHLTLQSGRTLWYAET